MSVSVILKKGILLEPTARTCMSHKQIVYEVVKCFVTPWILSIFLYESVPSLMHGIEWKLYICSAA